MANKQINALSELTSVEETDLLVVYDVDEGGSEKTKKILKSNFLAYEEGTFTPTSADAASGGSTGTTGIGHYTKIGRAVHINLRIQNIDTGGMTGGNIFYIQGLPFTSIGGMMTNGVVRADTITFPGYLTVSLTGGTSSIYLADNTSAGANAVVTVSELSSGVSDVRITMTYFTA